jgi:tetratricopeptide (TPR) repeat protein
LDKVSEHSLLVEEMIRELNADRTIPDELRREAIQLAAKRGNASYAVLLFDAWKTGEASYRSSEEYHQALHRATAAAHVAPWLCDSPITLGLLQYRTGEFDQALLSAQRAIEIQKSQGPDAHAIRAMAYFRLHDPGRAQSEAAMGRKAADQSKVKDDHKLLEEAESLIGLGKAGPHN